MNTSTTEKNLFQKISVLVFFFATFVSAFAYGLHKNPSLLNPLSIRQSIFDQIYPKLNQVYNNYKVHKKLTVIAPVDASTVTDSSNAYVVVDYDSGEVIAEKNMSQPVSIASLTKVMTAVVALDLANPSDQITISQRAANEIPTKIGVVPGSKMTLEELLKAALITSANDAADAIQDGVNAQYGEDVFVKAMNAKAQFIGLKHTHFSNPKGFDSPENYSTAEDLAILSHYALVNYPKIAEIVKQDYAVLPENQYHKEFKLNNWNGLIDVYPGVFGVKIGNTAAAGTTTIAISERNGKKILTVLLGAPDILKRDLEAAQLLDLGFEATKGLPPINVTEQQMYAKYATWQS